MHWTADERPTLARKRRAIPLGSRIHSDRRDSGRTLGPHHPRRAPAPREM